MEKMKYRQFDFFIYGCEGCIDSFRELAGEAYEILDSGKLRETDVNYGKDCAFEPDGEGVADSFVLVRLGVY